MNTQNVTTRDPEDALLEAEASKLADRGDVELAWCLRGMNDVSTQRGNFSHEAGQYQSHYLRGYQSTKPGDVVSPDLAAEVLGDFQ